MPSLTPNIKILSILAKSSEKQKLNFSPKALFQMKTRVCLKYFVHDCLFQQSFASDSPQLPSNLICLTILVTLVLTRLFLKSCLQKLLKICINSTKRNTAWYSSKYGKIPLIPPGHIYGQRTNLMGLYSGNGLGLVYGIWAAYIREEKLLPIITSFIKGDHVYSLKIGIGELLFCKLEPGNPFSIQGNALKVVKTNRNDHQIIGHLPD